MRRLLALAAVGLIGCPASTGFGGRVVGANGPVEAISVTDTHEIRADALHAIPGARVMCDGCPKKVEIDPSGRFSVSLGSSYFYSASPAPIVLHVTAPGYQPIDLEMPHPPGSTELGPRLFVVVMKRASPVAPSTSP